MLKKRTLVDEELPESIAHLVGHLLREISGTLLNLISPLQNDAFDNDQTEGVKKLNAVLELLKIDKTDVVAREWRSLIKGNQRLHKYAHRNNLDNPYPVNDEFRDCFDKSIRVFLEVLRKFKEHYGLIIEYIDEIITSNEPPASIKTRLPSNFVTYKYLFEKLQNPRWLTVLKNKQFFSYLPELIQGNGEVLQGSSRWPQIDYLARMVKTDDYVVQQQVLEIFLQVGKTNNYHIHWRMAEVAQHMFPDLGVQWAGHMIGWLRDGNKTVDLLNEELAKLAIKLAESKEREIAVKLAAELLNVFPDPDAERKCNPDGFAEEAMYYALSPRGRCDKFGYQQILEIIIPVFEKAIPFETLEMLCELLEKTVLYSVKNPLEQKPRDGFHLSRPSIADHDQNHNYDFKDPLITALRMVSESIYDRDPHQLERLVARLEEYEWDIFYRMGLYILKHANPKSVDLIEPRLVNETNFNSGGVLHEYFELLKDRYGELSEEGKHQILAWIAEAKRVKQLIEEQDGDRPDEEKDERLRYWQYKKLLAIHDYLTGDWEDLFNKLKDEFGEPDIPPGFSAWIGDEQIGPRSTKMAEELGGLSMVDLVAYLKVWEPKGDWMGPTPEGLGCALCDLVKIKSNDFVQHINVFMDDELDPTYIGHLVRGFCLVVERGEQLPYDVLFKLCRWVVEKPVEIAGRIIPESLRAGFDVDVDWRHTRSEIARLLEKVFSSKHDLPYKFRDDVWQIIEPLTNDAEPDMAYEETYGGDNMDPLSFSINTVRGKAMHDVMCYALWVCRAIKDRLREEEGRGPGFDDIPEVRTVLEDHLDVKKPFGQFQTDRAIYGQWLPQLVAVDREWVQAHLSQIFPTEPEQRNLRMAAWHTHLMYTGNLYKNIAMMLKGIYAQEVESLAGKDVPEDVSRTVDTRLIEHLVILYACGDIGLEKNGLLDCFFQKASPVLTGHAMKFVGKSLSKKNDAPTPEELSRFQGLWEWRVNVCNGSENMPKQELAAFVTWFAVRKFEAGWSFKYLEDTLRFTSIEPFHFTGVFEYMETIFSDYPMESLRCVRLFVENSRDPWFHFRSDKKQAIRKILEQGVQADNAYVREESISIVHLLVSQGFLEYRDLVSAES